MLIDTHCHVADPEFDADRDEVIARAQATGVEALISVGCDLASSRRAVALAEKVPSLFATVGVHPHEAKGIGEGDFDRLRELVRHPRVVAYGEIGLDFHYDYSPRPVQTARFADQIRMASGLSLPLVIHTREAWEETFEIMKAEGAERLGGVFHCFTGGPAEAERALAIGFYISFSGIATFPKAENIRAAARVTPLDRLLIETDSPYLAPQGMRGKRNEPSNVRRVAEILAETTGHSIDEIARATTENAKRLFFSKRPIS
jgi:TatD DNase family protein